MGASFDLTGCIVCAHGGIRGDGRIFSVFTATIIGSSP
jgi:hypothetical protein